MIARLRALDSRMLTILSIVLVQFVGATMVIPILPLYASREFTLEPQVVTLLISTFFIAQFIASPIIGRLSDNYGRVPVLIISQIGTVISFLMLVVAQAPWVLFVSRILDGATGGNIIVAQAYITDITPRERRTQALGLIFAALGMGLVLGPAFGGVLSSVFGTRIPFLFAGIAAIIPVILTWRVLDETVTPEIRERNRNFKGPKLSPIEILTNWPLMLVLIISFIGQFGLGILQSTFALYGDAVLFANYDESVTLLGVGLLLAVAGFGQLLTQLVLLQRALNRFGEGRLVLLGEVLRGFAFVGIVIVSSPFLAAPLMFMFALGSGFMMPSLQSVSTTTVADELRGGVLGVYQSSLSLSIIASTAVAGMLFAITPETPFLIGGILFFVATIPTVILVRWLNANVEPLTPDQTDTPNTAQAVPVTSGSD